jgi:alpha-1,2-mannosyltransferase
MHFQAASVPKAAWFETIRLPRRWMLVGLGLWLLVIVVFGALVEYRSAFLKRRMTDLDVYLRAAWAVRSGADLYAITDDNGWHYHYPPLLAIALAPLADAPAGYNRAGMPPFWMSVLLWYALSIGFLAIAIESLSRALEEARQQPGKPVVVGSLRWWSVRLLPLVICLPPVGHTLMRGQVNLLLLCFLALMASAYLRGHSWRAGSWLAAAICLKIIPAFLLIYPVWRRDFRSLIACAIGLGLGLGLIPAAVFGPQKTIDYYREWDRALRQPALGDGPDRSRAKELIEITATDSQSYLAVLHNLLHWERSTRPAQATPLLHLSHWLIGGVLTVITLAARGLKAKGNREEELMFLGGLILMMILASPVCHLHYFCLVIPMVMAITVRLLEGGMGHAMMCSWTLAAAAYLTVQILPQLPRLEKLRDGGVAIFAALLVWIVAIIFLFRSRQVQATTADRIKSAAA